MAEETIDQAATLLNRTLRTLDEWRHLPAYQLERRVDVFFGMFLPKVVEKSFGFRVDKVIPEFPIHRCILGEPESKKCVYVDFAVFGHQGEEKHLLLVELKTDMQSRRDDQWYNMVATQAAGSEALFCGVIKAARNTEDKKHKYAHLIWRLLELECLLTEVKKITNVVLKNPRGISAVFEDLSVGEQWRHSRVHLAVILPTKPKKPLPEAIEVISFDQFADILEEGHETSENHAEGGFTDKLRDWANVPAGRKTPWPR